MTQRGKTAVIKLLICIVLFVIFSIAVKIFAERWCDYRDRISVSEAVTVSVTNRYNKGNGHRSRKYEKRDYFFDGEYIDSAHNRRSVKAVKCNKFVQCHDKIEVYVDANGEVLLHYHVTLINTLLGVSIVLLILSSVAIIRIFKVGYIIIPD